MTQKFASQTISVFLEGSVVQKRLPNVSHLGEEGHEGRAAEAGHGRGGEDRVLLAELERRPRVDAGDIDLHKTQAETSVRPHSSHNLRPDFAKVL